MTPRLFAVAIAAAGAVVSLSPAPAAAQAAGAAGRAAAWTTPRTPWGDPDLQGTFSNRTITPFERPANVEAREFFTPEEVAALEGRAQQSSGDANRQRGTAGDVTRAYNDFWWDRGTKVTSPRTSLVIDPPDGRVPRWTMMSV